MKVLFIHIILVTYTPSTITVIFIWFSHGSRMWTKIWSASLTTGPGFCYSTGRKVKMSKHPWCIALNPKVRVTLHNLCYSLNNLRDFDIRWDKRHTRLHLEAIWYAIRLFNIAAGLIKMKLMIKVMTVDRDNDNTKVAVFAKVYEPASDSTCEPMTIQLILSFPK